MAVPGLLETQIECHSESRQSELQRSEIRTQPINQGFFNDGFLDVIQQKTGAWLLIPIHPELAEIIAIKPVTGGFLQN